WLSRRDSPARRRRSKPDRTKRIKEPKRDRKEVMACSREEDRWFTNHLPTPGHALRPFPPPWVAGAARPEGAARQEEGSVRGSDLTSNWGQGLSPTGPIVAPGPRDR